MKDIILNVLREYHIPGVSYRNVTKKCAKVTCSAGNCFLLKECNLYTEEKYKYLRGQSVDNILYPLKNDNNKYVTKDGDHLFIVMPYVENNYTRDEVKANKLENELNKLHVNTSFRRELSPLTSRKKLEEIYNYLQYKFDVLEAFVRTIEARNYDEYSILILKEYHNILDAKMVMGNLNKKIVEHVKVRKTVDYTFVHNNPKLDHLLNTSEADYLISIGRGKVGVPSLDLVKFYIETEDVNVDRKEMVMNYLQRFHDDFYFDYFCFFVLLYYIKSIIIYDKDYVSSQSFVYAGEAIKTFITDFNLK